MNIRGTEYYDVIDWGGGVTNRPAKKYLEYSVHTMNASNLYAYEGLYMNAIAFKYDTFAGNDIWINFKYRYVTGMGSNYDFNIFSPLSHINANSSIVDEKICVDNRIAAFKLSGNPSIPSDLWNSPNNGALRGEGDSNGAVNLTSYYNSGDLHNYHIYGVHVTSNTFTYYMDGNLLGSINSKWYNKSFSIGEMYGGGNTSSYKNSYSAIQWITLTDNMSLKVPKPPYALDEKENDMYGILKE